jgi:hypothetical protein
MREAAAISLALHPLRLGHAVVCAELARDRPDQSPVARVGAVIVDVVVVSDLVVVIQQRLEDPISLLDPRIVRPRRG